MLIIEQDNSNKFLLTGASRMKYELVPTSKTETELLDMLTKHIQPYLNNSEIDASNTDN